VIIFKDIQLDDKPLFDRYFSAKPYENSEFSFTNLFIWRLSYHFQFAVIHDHLCIMALYRNQYPCIFAPLSLNTPSYEKVLPVLARTFHEKGYPLVLKSVPEQQKDEIQKALPGRILFREDRWGHVSSADCGRVGGNMLRRLVAMAEESLAKGSQG
jgi:hypothetical protein